MKFIFCVCSIYVQVHICISMYILTYLNKSIYIDYRKLQL